MYKIKQTTVFMAICLVALLFLFVKQMEVAKRETGATEQERLIKLSYEIIESSNSIFDLQKELEGLKQKNDSFSFDIKDKTKVKEELENRNSNYRLINGVEPVSGRGIELKVEGDMVTEELIDLVNGIRNTKPRAISINNRRVIYRSYFIVKDGKLEFDDKKYDFPIYIQVLGDPDVLRKSLDRSGGILDVLKKNSFDKIRFTIENKDNITAPAYDKNIQFRYSKITS